MTKHRYSRLSFSHAASLTLTVTVLVTLTGCNNIRRSIPNAQPKSAIQTQLSPAVQTVVGDYASEGYNKRQQGYDWVGVMVRSNSAAEIDIKVRARSDIKQPSCTFDGKASLVGQDNAHGVIFQTIANDSETFFQFKDGVLTIDSRGKYALNYFCSGGGTLVGEYQKLAGNLERSQRIAN
ncbi:hypothetical protein [Psychrobacter frigidicola]|uniref:hypothetical protein n=1 Tax=Psychrobacter frigidicola TaxID=45611 RepID=UPI001918CC3B|nr:hypothetical protein [Psychrobacter frigidicola]